MAKNAELEAIIAATGKSNGEFAKAAQISLGGLNKYLAGTRRRVGVRELGTMAEAAGVSIATIRTAIADGCNLSSTAKIRPAISEVRRSERASEVSTAVAIAMTLPESTRQLFTEQHCPWTDAGDVSELAKVTGASLERRYSSVGGMSLCDVGVAIHQRAVSWLGSSRHSDEVNSALEKFCGELSIWIGWIALDAGQVATAESFLQEALLHARMAGCAQTEICALNNMSVLNVRAGAPGRARKMAEVALRLGREESPHLRSLLHLRAAVASGYLGDVAAFSEHVSQAKKQFERGAGPVAPAWFRSFSEGELIGLVGWGQLMLGNGTAAANAFRTTMSGLDDGARRARVHYAIQLARAMAAQGDVSGAANIGASVLADVRDISSNAVRQDFAGLFGVVSRSKGKLPREFTAAYSDSAKEVAPLAG